MVVKKALKTEVLHVRVSPRERQAIEAAAARDHRTVSGWIMALILRTIAEAPPGSSDRRDVIEAYRRSRRVSGLRRTSAQTPGNPLFGPFLNKGKCEMSFVCRLNHAAAGCNPFVRS
jgi:hypothetical protein